MDTNELYSFLIYIKKSKCVNNNDINWRDQILLGVLERDDFIKWRFEEGAKMWYITDKGEDFIKKGGYNRLAECQKYQAKAKIIAITAIVVFFTLLFIGIVSKLWFIVVFAFIVLFGCILYGIVNDKKYKW